MFLILIKADVLSILRNTLKGLPHRGDADAKLHAVAGPTPGISARPLDQRAAALLCKAGETFQPCLSPELIIGVNIDRFEEAVHRESKAAQSLI